METNSQQAFVAAANLLALAHLIWFSFVASYKVGTASSAAVRRHHIGRLLALMFVTVAAQAMVWIGWVSADSAALGLIGTCWYMHFFVKQPRNEDEPRLIHRD